MRYTDKRTRTHLPCSQFRLFHIASSTNLVKLEHHKKEKLTLQKYNVKLFGFAKGILGTWSYHKQPHSI